MNTELFELWFKHHFLAHASPSRPLLLVMDGHSTHLQFATSLNTFDPATGQGVLWSPKTGMEEGVQRIPNQTSWEGYHPLSILRAVWCSMDTQYVNDKCDCRFHTTGIYPFNRHALLPVPPTPSKFNPSALCKGTHSLKDHTCTWCQAPPPQSFRASMFCDRIQLKEESHTQKHCSTPEQ